MMWQDYKRREADQQGVVFDPDAFDEWGDPLSPRSIRINKKKRKRKLARLADAARDAAEAAKRADDESSASDSSVEVDALSDEGAGRFYGSGGEEGDDGAAGWEDGLNSESSADSGIEDGGGVGGGGGGGGRGSPSVAPMASVDTLETEDSLFKDARSKYRHLFVESDRNVKSFDVSEPNYWAVVMALSTVRSMMARDFSVMGGTGGCAVRDMLVLPNDENATGASAEAYQPVSRFCRTLFQIERAALHSYSPVGPHSC